MRRRGKMIVFLMLLSTILFAGSIAGEITVTGDNPVNCDLILINTGYPNTIEQIQTIESGADYIFTDLSPGEYILQITPQSEHYLVEFYEDAISPEAAEVIILSGYEQEISGIDIVLEYYDAPGLSSLSGTVSGSGEYLESVEVILYGVMNSYWHNYSEITNTSGEFDFSAVMPGTYLLFTDHVPGYHHYFWEDAMGIGNADIIQLESGEELIDLEIILEPLPSYSISGTVYQSEGGNTYPLSNALVSGYAFNCWGEGEYFQEITDEYGHYSTETRSGMYWLFCHKEGYWDNYWQGAMSFEDADPLQVNHDLNEIDFLMESTGEPQVNSVSGLISLEGEEPGFPCLVIVIASDEDDDWSETTISESNGYYYIDEIPAGDYYVVMLTSMTPPVYYPEGFDWENAEEVYIEGNVTDINFSIDEMSANGIYLMEGLVTGDGREPLSGASVIFFDEDGMPVSYGMSDNNGLYSAYSIPAGEYSVLAGKTYYESDNIEVVVTADGEIDFDLIRSATDGDSDALPFIRSSMICYPNPFHWDMNRSNLQIKFTSEKSGIGQISLYNIKGEFIETIYSGWFTGRSQDISYNSDSLDDLSSGVYLLGLEQSEETQQVQKLLLLK